MAMPAHNAPGTDPPAFGAEPGQVAVGGQLGMGSGCGGDAAVLWRTPEGAAGTGGVPGSGPAPQLSDRDEAAGSGGTDDPAVDRGRTGATDSGGTPQMGSPSCGGTRWVPHDVQEVRPGSLSVPHQAQRILSTHPPRCSKDRGSAGLGPAPAPRCQWISAAVS